MNQRNFECYDCKHRFGVPRGTARPDKCPECGSTNIHRVAEERGPQAGAHGGGAVRMGRGRGMGRGRRVQDTTEQGAAFNRGPGRGMGRNR